MSTFRDLTAEMDSVIFETMTDDVTINGLPVKGMFSAPWLQPQIGRLNTGIIEPQVVVRDSDVLGVEKGDPVVANGDTYEIVNIEPDGSGVTGLILRPLA
ncbi:ATP-binding sugar transporter Gifsy-2 [Nitrosomonas oligotropha]|uniref:ATP-binding sugar transporter Gifsy-2 n=1 Tax=Nitrosomonas oligotropha TaxID=42354 RepID=A0A2T5HH13_9PROT|nr:hypothetical protein [Nitrosomonas oligotropha]PTQ70844.1 ATP-binding sugar transporter Gifsy-2 [Nitrosomonas oligotropha]